MILPNRLTMYRFLDPLFTNVRFDAMAFTILYYACMLEEDSHAAQFDNKSVSMLQYLKDHPKFKTSLTQYSLAEERLLDLVKTSSSGTSSTVKKKVSEFLRSLLTYRQRFRMHRELTCRDMKKELVEIVHQRPELFLDVEAYKTLVATWPDYGKHVVKRAAERATLLDYQRSP